MSIIDPSLLIPYYKRVGQTPLECVKEYRKSTGLAESHTLSYAGRLDPMAEGVLLLLRDAANQRRREFEHLSKQYEVTILCGYSTDTGDLMGKISNCQFSIFKCQRGTQVQEGVKKVLPSFLGLIEQKYPVFSSRKVKGKALYWWARHERLSEVEIPYHQVQIHSIGVIDSALIKSQDLLSYIVSSVGSVQGDFRQGDIMRRWQDILSQPDGDASHLLITLRVDCGSGVFMRQLVQDIGDTIRIPMCAYSIRRTKVGDYTLDDCINVH